jgi:cobalt/nickel transport protein
MQTTPIRLMLAVGLLCLSARAAEAHFLVLRPSSDVIEAGRSVDLAILFTHPMEQGPVMDMAPPERFGVLAGGHQRDLVGQLRPKKIDGKTAYEASVRLDRPGDYVFYLQPAPYWESSEQTMIVHYTKVVVDFLRAEKGWDAMVGFPVEIEPLVRPYGLWTGNTFRGIVRHGGRPVPYARIEVEYLNEGRAVKVPNDAFVTQLIKADANGVFAYSMPKAGWWGFAALIPGQEKMKAPNGKLVDVELGGVMWVRTVDMK